MLLNKGEAGEARPSRLGVGGQDRKWGIGEELSSRLENIFLLIDPCDVSQWLSHVTRKQLLGWDFRTRNNNYTNDLSKSPDEVFKKRFKALWTALYLQDVFCSPLGTETQTLAQRVSKSQERGTCTRIQIIILIYKSLRKTSVLQGSLVKFVNPAMFSHVFRPLIGPGEGIGTPSFS